MNIFERIQNEIDKKKEEKRLAEERKRRQEKMAKIYGLFLICVGVVGFLAVIIFGDAYETETPPATEKQEEIAEAAPDLIEDTIQESPESDAEAQQSSEQPEMPTESSETSTLACIQTGLSDDLHIFTENYNKTHNESIEVHGTEIELPHMTISSNTGREDNMIFIYFESTLDQTEENKELFLDEIVEYLPLFNPCYDTETGIEIVNQVLESQEKEGNISRRGTFETDNLKGDFVEYVTQAPFNINYIFEIRFLPEQT